MLKRYQSKNCHPPSARDRHSPYGLCWSTRTALRVRPRSLSKTPSRASDPARSVGTAGGAAHNVGAPSEPRLLGACPEPVEWVGIFVSWARTRDIDPIRRGFVSSLKGLEIEIDRLPSLERLGYALPSRCTGLLGAVGSGGVHSVRTNPLANRRPGWGTLCHQNYLF